MDSLIFTSILAAQIALSCLFFKKQQKGGQEIGEWVSGGGSGKNYVEKLKSIWSKYVVGNGQIINKIYPTDEKYNDSCLNPPNILYLCLLCVVVLAGGNWYYERTSFWEWIWRIWNKAQMYAL